MEQAKQISKKAKDVRSRFEAQGYRYLNYDGLKPGLLLKSRFMKYNNANSQFEMKNLVSRMKSGDDFVYISAREGTHYIQNKNFDFYGGVKIVIEKKYLLEGPFFKWLDKEKVLKSNPAVPVIIRDIDNLSMQGKNFIFSNTSNKFTLEDTTIIIPEKIAKDEGLD